MSNPIRIRDALDQENDHKNLPAKSKQKLQLNQENVRVIQNKRPRPSSGPQQQKRVRVPLAGKDQNLGFPTLQRSKSSVTNPNFSNTPNVIQNPIQRSLRPISATLPKQPTLTKSNSTLGFTHKPASITLGNHNRNANPHKNNILPSEEAHRPQDLVPRFSTDSLKKAIHAPLPALTTSLKDTLSESTQKLHANNVVNRDLYRHQGDPIKKPNSITGSAQDDLIERLADDPESVEFVAKQDLPEPKHVPFGLTSFLTEDLEFIRTGIRKSQPPTIVLDLSFESTSDEDNIEDEEGNLALEEELMQSGLVGLSAQELNDLLEF